VVARVQAVRGRIAEARPGGLPLLGADVASDEGESSAALANGSAIVASARKLKPTTARSTHPGQAAGREVEKNGSRSSAAN